MLGKIDPEVSTSGQILEKLKDFKDKELLGRPGVGVEGWGFHLNEKKKISWYKTFPHHLLIALSFNNSRL